MRAQDLRRAVATALALSMVSVGVMTAGAAAIPPTWTLTFDAERGSCIDGESNHALDLELYDRHGNDIDGLSAVAPDLGGHFHACFATGMLTSGGSIHATNTSTLDIKSFTFPSLSVKDDRVTDVVKGTTVADSHVTIRLKHCPVTAGCGSVVARTVPTDHHGRYSKDLTSAFALRGGDSVKVTWTSPEGSSWSRYQSPPQMVLEMGTGSVAGQVNPGQHATFRLRTHPGGSVLSTRSITGNSLLGSYSVTFASHLVASRQVTSDFASDAHVTVPSTSTTYPIQHGKQKIRSHCLPDRAAVIYWNGIVGHAVRTADSHGRLYVNLGSVESSAFRLPHSSNLRIVCSTSAGDTIIRDLIVP
jgi:hypothetical protein